MRDAEFQTGSDIAAPIPDWRARIEANIGRATAQRVRALFREINPHLRGDKLFEDRWTVKRMPAAVLIPIIDRQPGPTILLTVRSADMPSHAGQISLPGGRVHENDHDAVAAALRETHEEVNIEAEKIDVVGALGVHEGGLGYAVTPVVGVVDPSADIQPCPREVAEVFEVPLSFVADLGNHRTEERVHKGVSYNMFASPYGRYHVWGLTAGILRTFAETLQETAADLGDRGR
jgi:8-oxo-dGTP pyrophosphatase MutT (NUDIX family)